jgi:hypothetical protein
MGRFPRHETGSCVWIRTTGPGLVHQAISSPSGASPVGCHRRNRRKSCGGRSRTRDQRLNKTPLCQLSYPTITRESPSPGFQPGASSERCTHLCAGDESKHQSRPPFGLCGQGSYGASSVGTGSAPVGWWYPPRPSSTQRPRPHLHKRTGPSPLRPSKYADLPQRLQA